MEPAARFYPASGPAATLPLGRYLPPLPAGMARAWLDANVSPGGWLLDPLGASPALALEAARAGYRVIVACNNPILSFMIETLACAPNAAEIQSALAELAQAKRGDERLERHIQSLYLTECAQCGEAVPAEGFLWRKGETLPYARLYRCPKCGEGGERPVEREVTAFDTARLALPGSDALHRSRALQRVVLSEDEYRQDVDQALASYLPRPLYALFTLLNKIEGLDLPPTRLRLLQALMISAFDAGSTLWTHPGSRLRPRQLLVPAQFRENNLWRALEDAAAEWSQAGQGEPVPVTQWPALPPQQGGICLFHGRVKSLIPLPEGITPDALLTVAPRPNQAFWTLSVLWAGWLWGREAALPLRNVLDRRRYDWNWHTSALHSALAALSRAVPARTPFFALLPELVPGFLNAALTAGEAAGFHLDGLALRGEGDLAQVLWRPGGPLTGAAGNPEEIARAAMQAELRARSEPAPYLVVYAAGLEALARQRAIPESMPGGRGKPGIPGDLFTRLQTCLSRPFSDRAFLRVASSTASGAPNPPRESARSGKSEGAGVNPEDERGWWWLTGATSATASALPLTDRIEREIVRSLQKNPVLPFTELEQALCAHFTGLQTPPVEVIRAVLESYGEALPGQPGIWRLRPGDTPAARRADLAAMHHHLTGLGHKLGFTVSSDSGDAYPAVVYWHDSGEPAWSFYLMASSIISRYVLTPPAGAGGQRVLVLPGGRARLLAYKLRRDPRLAEAAAGWRILKYRHLRDLSETAALTRDQWETLLDEDPLTDEASQIRLL